MKFRYFLFTFLSLAYGANAQTVLTHNVGTNLRQTSIYTCSYGGIEWARSFVLEDFGITTDQEFTIYQGEVGFSAVGVYDVNIGFNIYEIDNDFPVSFDRNKLIGSSEVIRIYQSGFQLVTLAFTEPVVVPSNVERILVEVRQEFSNSSAVTFIAGTAEDNDFSWFNTPNGGCAPESYTTTEALGRSDARFYINVTGTKSLGVNTQANKEFLIFPNPTKEYLRFKEFNNPIDEVEILNVQGKLLIHQLKPDQLNVSQLPSGIYFVRVRIQEKISIQKFIKE